MTVPDFHFKRPAVVYIDSRNAIHRVDGDNWDPQHLSDRDRILCVALLKYALDRLEGRS